MEVATLILCLVLFGLVVVILAATNIIRIVPEYQRLVVFRLGRVNQKPKGPGIVILDPDHRQSDKGRPARANSRSPSPDSITKDNAPISIDFLWYFKVLEPSPERASGW